MGTSTQGKKRGGQKAILRKHLPSLFSQLASGKPLQPLLQEIGVHWETFHRELDARPELREAYSRARRYCVEKWVSDIVPMSDAVIGEEMNVVTATRNAVDVRKWVASKLMPREYGEQGTGVTINQQTNLMVVSEEKLKSLQETRLRMLKAQASTDTQ